MNKQSFLVFIILLAFIMTAFTHTGMHSQSKSEDEHITFENLENGNIIYQDNEYYLSQMSFLLPEKVVDSYKYLGWSGSKYLSSSNVYGDSYDNPLFLYFTETCNVYLRKNYDYTTDVFMVEGTDGTIHFADDLTEIDGGMTVPVPNKEIVITSVNQPVLQAHLYVYTDGDCWYAKSRTMKTFKLSNHFIEILKEASLISETSSNVD